VWPFQSRETGDKVAGILFCLFIHMEDTRKKKSEGKEESSFSQFYLYIRRISYPVLEPSHLIPLTPSTLLCSLAEAFAKTLMTCLFFHTIEFVGFKREGWKTRDHWAGRNREHARVNVMYTIGQSRIVS
jgi:hypothetical protein